MHTHDKFAKMAVLMLIGSLAPGITTLAKGESDSVRALYISAATVPTSNPGIRTYPEPPKGFNALTATDVELATYGFPPRPDKEADSSHYALWERAMKLAKIRWNGELKPVPGTENVTIPAGSSMLPAAVQSQTGPQAQPNVNAAGVILTNKQTAWSNKSSFDVVVADISVPVAQLPFGDSTCTYDYKEFNFAGIDSFYENLNGKVYILFPGLQGGFYGDIPCTGSGTAGTPFYYAEFGFGYPLSRGFPVNPGDVFFTVVEAFGPSSGEAYLEDLTTETFAAYSISASGIIGQNAGWLVFRPCCTGGSSQPPSNVFPLANTVATFFDNAEAQAGSKSFYPGSQATSTLILNMMDDEGDQVIESANQGSGGYEGQHAIYFETAGCAYSGGCVQ